MTGPDLRAAERAVRELRAAGRLAEAVRLVGNLGPYGVADGPDATVSLGAFRQPARKANVPSAA